MAQEFNEWADIQIGLYPRTNKVLGDKDGNLEFNVT